MSPCRTPKAISSPKMPPKHPVRPIADHPDARSEGERKRNCRYSRSNHRHKVQLGHPAGTMNIFKKAAKEPQRKQFEGGIQNPGMEEAVGDQLPDVSVGYQGRNEGGIADNRRNCAPGEQAEHEQGKEDAEIPKNQLAGEAAKLGKSHDTGAAWHRRRSLPCSLEHFQKPADSGGYVVHEIEFQDRHTSRDSALLYRSGVGVTTRLRCPASSTARTPKMTLSFDTGSVALRSPCVSTKRCQLGAEVSLQTIW